jgi:hypothetical protein
MARRSRSRAKTSTDLAVPECKLLVAGTIRVPKQPPFAEDDADFEQSHNMSGLFCPNAAGWGLMVADELQGFHRLRVDRNGKTPKVLHDAALTLELPSQDFLRSRRLTSDDLQELDLEGIAAVGGKGPLSGKVIFIGSHANTRNSGKPNAGAHLIAVADVEVLRKSKKKPVPARWASLDPLLRRFFAWALYSELQCNGINIEGATVFERRLLIGLRSPTETGRQRGAYVLSTPLDGLMDEDFSKAELHIVPMSAPSIGIRSMERVGRTVLLVTGDAGVNDLRNGTVPACGSNLNPEKASRPFELVAWRPRSGRRPKALLRFPPQEAEEVENGKIQVAASRAKVEGIAVAQRNGSRVSLFVVYDGSDKVFYLPDVKLPG